MSFAMLLDQFRRVSTHFHRYILVVIPTTCVCDMCSGHVIIAGIVRQPSPAIRFAALAI